LSPPIFRTRVVLLDWDGTLLNSYGADKRAYIAMFRALQIEWEAADIDRHYSPDWYHVYRAAGIPRAKWMRANRLWRAAYGSERPALLPAARSVLRALAKTFTLAIVTSGSRDRVRPQIRSFGFAGYFSACIYSESTLRKKPYPDPLYLALKRLRAKPEESVYALACAPSESSVPSPPPRRFVPQNPTCCCARSAICRGIWYRRSRLTANQALTARDEVRDNAISAINRRTLTHPNQSP
jgi:beta-phosphoglucomutase-like phosphatase (HAD superfamily)